MAFAELCGSQRAFHPLDVRETSFCFTWKLTLDWYSNAVLELFSTPRNDLSRQSRFSRASRRRIRAQTPAICMRRPPQYRHDTHPLVASHFWGGWQFLAAPGSAFRGQNPHARSSAAGTRWLASGSRAASLRLWWPHEPAQPAPRRGSSPSWGAIGAPRVAAPPSIGGTRGP